MSDLSTTEARRIALAAQGFAKPRPARATAAHLKALAARAHLFQIDSVNVLVRAHYMPAFSRLGAYDMAALDSLAYSKRALFEYWGHEASLIEMSMYPLFRWRMAQAWVKTWFKTWDRNNPGLIDATLGQVRERGPLGISELGGPGKRGEPWWGWSQGKFALEMLFAAGKVAATTRRNFERIYDITERVIPKAVLRAPQIPDRDAQRTLLLLGARALGVGTASDIADYFRINKPVARKLIAELASEGALTPVRVEGWKDPAFLHPDAKVPRGLHARALLSPFDPVVWERSRAERLFGMRYRIEIYVPAHKRVHGYYVLPLLLGDSLVARADLKADRARSTLIVHAAYTEPGAPKSAARELADELRLMAGWLGLEKISVTLRGDLARPLKAALGRACR